MKAIIRTILTLLFVLLLATDVRAQCWRSADLEQMAEEQWQEHWSHSGVTTDGALARVYHNPETGTWTLTIVYPNGRECVLTAGDGWRKTNPVIAGQGT